jgi:hypothetical protein
MYWLQYLFIFCFLNIENTFHTSLPKQVFRYGPHGKHISVFVSENTFQNTKDWLRKQKKKITFGKNFQPSYKNVLNTQVQFFKNKGENTFKNKAQSFMHSN